MKIIGLTGGIASGKSTAARYLGDLGARLIDADVLGHRAYDPGTEAFDAVVATFGDDVVAADGSIDRKVLGGKVFGQPDKLKQLTDIVWPEIRRLAELELDKIAGDDPQAIAVLEAAVLFEAGWESIADEIWVVIVEPDVAVERAMARDNLEADAVRKRIEAQLSNNERQARCDVVIDNSGTAEDLCAKLDALWQSIAGVEEQTA